ncbi:hypothetical protein GIS00_15935 [Nakamurella sp. YIM 132087]|uniref:Uncharacterized protein n=1 Tax=Nakamurella alba TaxID=2665158 RepID=A0A7K1FMT4_9ACTN|nr:hypothetical protein [Nakamurella alba]MTD15428.1 hypothetical protein [Nakamurella alba]
MNENTPSALIVQVGASRRTRFQRAVLGVAALLPVLSTPGCAPTACTLTGAENTLTIQVSDDIWGPARSMTWCIDSDCRVHAITPGGSPPVILVDDRVGEAPILVEVRLAGENNTLLASGSTTLTPTVFQPNGPDCDPITWQAGALLTKDGLTPIPSG